MKRTGLNEIERALPDIRKRISKLPELARYETFDVIYRQIIYLRDEFDRLAGELYAIQNQEVLFIDAPTPSKPD